MKNMITMTDLEEKYLLAKDKYYNEEPIMSDAEFDELESKLKELGSSVVNVVGSFDRYAKYQHPTRMKSLAKIQADKNTGEPPLEEFMKWYKDIAEKLPKDLTLSFEEKLDGNAVNLVYEKGILVRALSRGDGELGRDYLPKLHNGQVPFTIPDKYNTIEVRCEAVIDKKLFAEKYSNFSNERNYVAGVLGSDSSTEEQENEIELVPVEMHYANDGVIEYHDITEIEDWGFKNYNDLLHLVMYPLYSSVSIEHIFINNFNFFKSLKGDSFKFRIDGMVIKLNHEYRNEIGEVEHHPKWAIAVKFKPEDCITEVIGFEMNMGKTGEFTPVALLKPVDLDGSIVSKATAYNYDFIVKNKLNVGAKVTLVKSGDIIPQIVNVVVPSDIPFTIDNMKCPYCGKDIKIVNDKHIVCSDAQCEGKHMKIFSDAIKALKLKGFGDAFLEKVYKYTHCKAVQLIKNRKHIKDWIYEHQGCKLYKIDEDFCNKIEKIDSINIETLISLVHIPGVSNYGRTCHEFACEISNIDYNFNGLNKNTISLWYLLFKKLCLIHINDLKEIGIEVKMLEDEKSNTINICMTGSPKNFGFETKKEFLNHLNSSGDKKYKETNIKDATILFTDDLSSNSSKMKTATKNDIEIRLYSSE